MSCSLRATLNIGHFDRSSSAQHEYLAAKRREQQGAFACVAEKPAAYDARQTAGLSTPLRFGRDDNSVPALEMFHFDCYMSRMLHRVQVI